MVNEQRSAEARAAVRLNFKHDADLPIAARREDISEALRRHPVCIVAGDTGSGKSTQLPQFCLEIGRGIDGLIAHTQPRRLAARALAARIAEELSQPIGAAVGFRVRFADRVSAATRLVLMTDGLLLAELASDPLLRRYDTIIVDEAHERTLNIDLLLGALKRALPRRPDLKLIVTSATLDVERVARFFDDAPVLAVSGRNHPIETRYTAQADDAEDPDLPLAILDAYRDITATPGPIGRGDVLVFLPGEREIRDVGEVLERELDGVEILSLYSRLSWEQQSKIFQRGARRRIVLATNVAETSITVPGIRAVIDSGLARVSRYSARSRLQRLPIEPVSRASADQRKGRCGRIGPGLCVRLYSESDFEARPPFTEPEILRTNLAALLLRLAADGLGEAEKFPFIDPPDSRALGDGYRLLQELEALDADRRITRRGRAMARLPLDPRLARALLESKRFHAESELLAIVAGLSVPDARIGGPGGPAGSSAAGGQGRRGGVGGSSVSNGSGGHDAVGVTGGAGWRGLVSVPGGPGGAGVAGSTSVPGGPSGSGVARGASGSSGLSGSGVAGSTSGPGGPGGAGVAGGTSGSSGPSASGVAGSTSGPGGSSGSAGASLPNVRSGFGGARDYDEDHTGPAVFEDSKSEFSALVKLWRAYKKVREGPRRELRRWCKERHLSLLRLSEWEDVYTQVADRARELGIVAQSRPASYTGVHRALLAGFCTMVGVRGEEGVYAGTRGVHFHVFPGSPLKRRRARWVMAANIVETSRIFGRRLAEVEPIWVESAAHHLLKREYLEPDWDEGREEVVARERISFLGLILSANRVVNYGPIAPEESRLIFAREALVYRRLQRRPEWLQENDRAIDDAQRMEERLRRRDLLQAPEQLVEFYDKALPRQVSSAATLEYFTRHLSEDQRAALILQPADIFARTPDAAMLERFPERVTLRGLGEPTLVGSGVVRRDPEGREDELRGGQGSRDGARSGDSDRKMAGSHGEPRADVGTRGQRNVGGVGSDDSDRETAVSHGEPRADVGTRGQRNVGGVGSGDSDRKMAGSHGEPRGDAVTGEARRRDTAGGGGRAAPCGEMGHSAAPRGSHLTLSVDYRFAPGEARDGATLRVPLLALPTLTRAAVDAAVPGLAEPRVEALLRSLPKDARRQLIPIGATVTSFMEFMGAPSTNVQRLASWLKNSRGVPDSLIRFDISAIPAHLTARLAVVEQGREAAQSSDLGLLRRRFAAAARAELERRARLEYPAPWRRFEVEELPRVVDLVVEEGVVQVYPTLARGAQGLRVHYEWTPEESAHQFQQGTPYLARLMLDRQARDLAKGLAADTQLLLAASPHVHGDTLSDLLLQLTFRRACFGDAEAPRTRTAFDAAINDARERLYPVFEEVVESARLWFGEARGIRRLLEDGRARSHADLVEESQGHLRRLFSGFVIDLTDDWLRQLTRYLKAEERRWQRLFARGSEAPQILRELREWTARADSLASRVAAESRWLPQLEDLKAWIEEYRVSLYAQELRTLGPVSAARLSARAAEIDAWLSR